MNADLPDLASSYHVVPTQEAVRGKRVIETERTIS